MFKDYPDSESLVWSGVCVILSSALLQLYCGVSCFLALITGDGFKFLLSSLSTIAAPPPVWLIPADTSLPIVIPNFIHGIILVMYLLNILIPESV